MEVHPHQLDTAHQAIHRLGGNAILADEVGLGKTVEAGLIVRELMSRGQIGKVLILVPASLTGQWAREMEQKFDLHFAVNPRGAGWLEEKMIIASLDLARRHEPRRLLQMRSFDLVVVDEAHRLKNNRTQSYALVAGLSRRYLQLLTATPIQNDLGELYNLVDLVRPGHFGAYLDFYRRFIFGKRTPRNASELQTLLGQVMIRHRRGEIVMELPCRRVEMVALDLSPAEADLYQATTRVVREEYRRRKHTHSLLPLVIAQKELCSSSFALSATLERTGEEWAKGARDGLLALARRIKDNAKLVHLLDLLRDGLRRREKVVVYTEYRATQDYLTTRLAEHGLAVVAFHGGLNQREKEAAQKRFREHGEVLVSTEAGAQGLNLQFANCLVNYDLPWNPMRVEQRIGRLHRMGQEKEVRIFNLCARGTVEEHVLHLLQAKIGLFRHCIGELDIILRHLEREKSWEGRIMEIILGSETPVEIEANFAALGEAFLARRKRLADTIVLNPG